MFSPFPSAFSYIFVLILSLLLGILGGFIARNDEHSFWLGFAVGLFGNILGVLILAYISGMFKKRKFEPAFKNDSNEKAAAINVLAKLNNQSKLSDQEYKRLKQEIIGS
ncbi:MAG TPA: hypothetical protein VK106_06965 [Balneolaceae bacterium]|nr:hypothetical protein [Balneolaceae bacterium]